jgi:hypothetical protein
VRQQRLRNDDGFLLYYIINILYPKNTASTTAVYLCFPQTSHVFDGSLDDTSFLLDKILMLVVVKKLVKSLYIEISLLRRE